VWAECDAQLARISYKAGFMDSMTNFAPAFSTTVIVVVALAAAVLVVVWIGRRIRDRSQKP